MSEIKEEVKQFNYDEIEDKEIAFYLQQKEKEIKEIVQNMQYDLGKKFKETQDKLASHNKRKGVFEKWYTALGFKKQTVYNYINYHDYVVQRLDNIEQIEALPKKLVYEMAKPNADKDLEEKVFKGEITSLKEYRAEKSNPTGQQENNEKNQEPSTEQKGNKEQENIDDLKKQITLLTKQLEQQSSKVVPQVKPKEIVVEKVVEKVVVDEEQTKKMQEQINSLIEEREKWNKEKNSLEEKLNKSIEKNEEYEETYSILDSLEMRMDLDENDKPIFKIKAIGNYIFRIEMVLEELSSMKYSKGFDDLSTDHELVEEIKRLFEKIDDCMDEIRQKFPDNPFAKRKVVNDIIVEMEEGNYGT